MMQNNGNKNQHSLKYYNEKNHNILYIKYIESLQTAALQKTGNHIDTEHLILLNHIM